MPRLRPGESRKSFVGRCIPIVKDEGTAKSNDQAVAICFSMYRQQKRKKRRKKFKAGENVLAGKIKQ